MDISDSQVQLLLPQIIAETEFRIIKVTRNRSVLYEKKYIDRIV